MIPAETIERCRVYAGRSRETTDSMSPEPAQRLSVLLGAALGQHLPLCWHWAYFNNAVKPEDTGHDGHERLGLFLPDVPLPRRMWASGEIEVLRQLDIGEPATRHSQIEEVTFKPGRSGDLCFVTLRHDIEQGQLCIVERQTIVYRQQGRPETALRSSDEPVPQGYIVVPDSTVLAYSAITQNGHRIHWDRDFCRDVESYPDLVVHGPLLATLLAQELDKEPKPCRFQYRAKAPVFVTSPFRIEKSGSTARIMRSDGVEAMFAEYF
ncbi:MAG: hypothetical protein AAF718_01785 [Pseudomonadota bacterium]